MEHAVVTSLRTGTAREHNKIRSAKTRRAWQAAREIVMSSIKLMKAASALNRRTLLKAGAAAGASFAFPHFWTGRASAANPMEIVHWSWLSASDGEVWAKMISNFNDAHKDKGVQIRMEVMPQDQYVTKVLAASATGKPPDFGWGTAGMGAQLARDNVTVPLDDL